MDFVIGISQMKVARDNEGGLITHALGSCLGVVVYDPVVKVGGLLHYLLPLSSLHVEDSVTSPCKYGDTGIPMLFQEAYRLGAAKDHLRVVIAGGGQFLSAGAADVGTRNVAIARRLFLKNRVLVTGESVGGNVPRTLRLDFKTGSILCKEGAQERVLA
jgi:chemotaxis protein CheD